LSTTARDWNAQLIEEYRANHGSVKAFPDGTVLLLHHRGAKSGEPRLNPLVYLREGARYALFATKGGSPTNPAWYYNLKASPNVDVELGDRKFAAVASEATGEERDRLYAAQAARMPSFAEYEARTSRKIPVMLLTPTD
jgi:deazaflavin-dependent oxidoreductase (nitroreductase family)